VLAELAIGRMRVKIPDLRMALEGRFDDHHALMCRLRLDHIDQLDVMIARLDAQIEAMMQPFRAQRDLLTTIPGIGEMTAASVLSEIGVDVAEFFPTAAHLASWAGMCPGNHESAGKRRHGKRRKGNQHLPPVLVEAAWAAVRHRGCLKSLCHRHVMRWGGYRNPLAKKKAIMVVAHAMLVIIWHVLATGKPYHELGEDYFIDRRDPAKETQRLVVRAESPSGVVGCGLVIGRCRRGGWRRRCRGRLGGCRRCARRAGWPLGSGRARRSRSRSRGGGLTRRSAGGTAGSAPRGGAGRRRGRRRRGR
jgi:hypothetical protein